MVDQAEIHRMTKSKDAKECLKASRQLSQNFKILHNKKQAWDDLFNLTLDEEFEVKRSEVKWSAVKGLISVFPDIIDKEQVWEDIHQLTQNDDSYVRWRAADALTLAFVYILDKEKIWDDLHELMQDEDLGVRYSAARAIGTAFVHIPNKKSAFDDLYYLTHDIDSDVRASAYYSLGKISIFLASNAETEYETKTELENALAMFEIASKQESYSKPARFCRPFYLSFFAITFNKRDEAELEIQINLNEARKAIEGSKSRAVLLEAINILFDALSDAHKPNNLIENQKYLNDYRRYIERVADMLDVVEDKAPVAARLVRKGLPISVKIIKGIIEEIQEKAKAACQQSKGTPTEDIACAANREIQKWRIDDQEGMTWAVENIIFILSSKIPHVPENKPIHDKIENIRNESDLKKQHIMIADVVALIPSVHVEIHNSTIGQIGNGQVIMNIDNNQKLTRSSE